MFTQYLMSELIAHCSCSVFVFCFFKYRYTLFDLIFEVVCPGDTPCTDRPDAAGSLVGGGSGGGVSIKWP